MKYDELSTGFRKTRRGYHQRMRHIAVTVRMGRLARVFHSIILRCFLFLFNLLIERPMNGDAIGSLVGLIALLKLSFHNLVKEPLHALTERIPLSILLCHSLNKHHNNNVSNNILVSCSIILTELHIQNSD